MEKRKVEHVKNARFFSVELKGKNFNINLLGVPKKKRSGGGNLLAFGRLWIMGEINGNIKRKGDES